MESQPQKGRLYNRFFDLFSVLSEDIRQYLYLKLIIFYRHTASLRFQFLKFMILEILNFENGQMVSTTGINPFL